jgi:hypothetical protein
MSIQQGHDRLTSSRDSRNRSLGVQKRDVNTPDVREALHFFEPRVRPQMERRYSSLGQVCLARREERNVA